MLYSCSTPKLKIAKYEKTYQSSLAAHMLLFTSDSDNDNGKRYILKVIILLYKNKFSIGTTCSTYKFTRQLCFKNVYCINFINR